MTARLPAAGLALAAALVALPIASAQPELEVVKEETVKLPLGLENWDIRQMQLDPVKVVKTDAVKRRLRPLDPEAKPEDFQEQTSAVFILEFVRDLTVRDTDWTGVRLDPPYRFDFLDADGVTLASQTARYDGIPIGRKGRRVRVVLALPPEGVMRRADRVLVEPKRYGDMP